MTDHMIEAILAAIKKYETGGSTMGDALRAALPHLVEAVLNRAAEDFATHFDTQDGDLRAAARRIAEGT